MERSIASQRPRRLFVSDLLRDLKAVKLLNPFLPQLGRSLQDRDLNRQENTQSSSHSGIINRYLPLAKG